MRTKNTKNYIKFALPKAVLLELVLLKHWFCYPCILHPWGIKIFKDTEKLTACMLWDATIDGSENFFRGMPCLCDLKYVLKASYLQTKEQFCLLIKQVKNNFWTNRQKYLHAIFLLKAAMLIWLVIRQSFLLTDCAKL